MTQDDPIDREDEPTADASEGFYVFDASFAQQRLWVLEKLAGGSAYTIARALRLDGALNVAALEHSIDALVERHESLRTTFEVEDGEPVQVIGEARAGALEIVDLTDERAPDPVPADRREVAALKRAAEEAVRPFDLEAGPLFRACLLRIDEQSHLLLLTLHHIIADGWSLGIIARELAALYQSFTRGEPSALAELPIQYADFAHWQREWLQRDVLAQQLAFWAEQLQDAPPLELPTHRPRPATQTFDGARHVLEVPQEDVEALRKLARDEDASLFMALFATFGLLLHRHTGQTDLVVGTAVANRGRDEVEGVVGCFVNSLALRCDLSGDPTFRELLMRVRGVSLAAYEHQDLPFEKLVEELQLERDLSQNPVFQVMVSLQNMPPVDIALDGLRVSEAETGVTITRLDLELHLRERNDGLSASFAYRKDLFDAETIERLADHYGALLRGVARHRDARASAVALLSEDEKRRILEHWNDTTTAYPRDLPVSELFARRAALQPDATALIYPDEGADSDEPSGGTRTLTYGQLAERVRAFARELAERGVARHHLVGLCIERSPEFVVAVLATLEAGAAYLPLDPEYPKARIAFMLEDAGVSLLLTQTHLRDGLPETNAPVLCIDDPGHEPTRKGALGWTPAAAGADDLAYVIYTSGSTGRPKGIAVPQRAIARLVLETDYVRLGPGDRVAQASNVSFDAATFEIFGALLTGATLVCIERTVLLSPRALARELRARSISTLFLTTALLNQVVREVPDAFGSLHTLLFGGEAVDPERVRELLAQETTPERLLHVYGPTEATTFSTWQRVETVEPEATTVPIGRPIANTRVYVLSPQMEPLPIGLPGELYLGGDGLATGYLGQPGMTAERFVPNPFTAFGADPGSRLYRTGDRVLQNARGEIEFLGRIDQQIKLRGFRIEVGEIETALLRHPHVENAAVVLREDTPGNRRLVGYVVAKEGSGDVTEALRAHLKEQLPGYMVPSVLVALDRLPLDPNGKIDRRALPAPNEATAGRPAERVPPTTPVEIAIAAIWCDLLERRDLGIHDNFFELGGHSLLATRVVSRVQEAFETEIPLSSIFRAPTVGEQANVVAEAVGGPEAAEALAEKLATTAPQELSDRADRITPRATPGPAPLSSGQQRLRFVDQLGAGAAYSMHVCVWLEGDLDVESLRTAFEAVVARHEVLRTVFLRNGAEWVQHVLPSRRFELPVAASDGAARPEEEAGRIVREELARPFDVETGPLFRAKLIRAAEARHVLLVTIHHAAFDGWSVGILGRELAQLYSAGSSDAGAELPELPIQYSDFAAWQRDRLEGGALRRQLEYWRARLEAAPMLDLPTDRGRTALPSFRGGRHVRVFSPVLTSELDALCQRAGVTLYMALLAGFQSLLFHYSREPDVVVGTAIANRNRSELEHLIGFFVNTLVMRTDVSGDPSVLQLLERTREVAVGAYENQDLPFDELVKALRPARDAARHPFFQVMFSVDEGVSGTIELEGLRVENFPVEGTTARFELEAELRRQPSGLSCSLHYAAHLFDPETIEQLAVQYEALLRAMASEPEARVGTLLERLGAWPPSGRREARSAPQPPPSAPPPHVAPSTPLELAIAGIWRDLLELEEVALHDNFFERGGHSLLATQVVSRLRDRLQAEVPISRFFRTPTVSGLTEIVAELFGSREAAEEVARTVAGLESLSDEEVAAALKE